MHSFTSSSEAEAAAGPAAPDEAGTRWRPVLLWLAVLAVILPSAMLGVLAAVDPYDTGRFSLIAARGVAAQGPRTANVSRGRDPQFNAAIIGNSRMQALSPERLNRLTGLRFVSLTVPGTDSVEQVALLRWFASHRAAPAAVVVGVDAFTCGAGIGRGRSPFPHWLYAGTDRAYLANLFRLDAVEPAVGRLAMLTGLRPAARADGRWDYEEGREWTRALDEALRRAPPEPLAASNGPYPMLEALADAVDALPASTRVVYALPPVFARLLPDPGSPRDLDSATCRKRLATRAAARPGAVIADLRLDSPLTRDPAAFWDATHYGRELADQLEALVAARLNSGP